MISSGKIFELGGVKMFFENNNIYNAETGEKLYNNPDGIDYIVYNINDGNFYFENYYQYLKTENNFNENGKYYDKYYYKYFYTKIYFDSKTQKINFKKLNNIFELSYLNSEGKNKDLVDEEIKTYGLNNELQYVKKEQIKDIDYPGKNLGFTSLLQIQNEKKEKEKQETEKKKEQENLAKKEEKKKEDLKNNKFFNDVQTDFLGFEYKKITEDGQTYLLVDNTKFENYVMQKINEFTTFFYITIFFLFVYLNFIIFKKLLGK